MFDPVTLIKKALEARENAYSPYSRFCVGAALICSDGELFLGANVENSSFGGTICAERSAFCAAISQGKRDFEAISIVGGFKDKQIEKLCAPCGICRQFMTEFNYDMELIIAKANGEYKVWSLKQLLPEAFTPESLL